MTDNNSLWWREHLRLCYLLTSLHHSRKNSLEGELHFDHRSKHHSWKWNMVPVLMNTGPNNDKLLFTKLESEFFFFKVKKEWITSIILVLRNALLAFVVFVTQIKVQISGLYHTWKVHNLLLLTLLIHQIFKIIPFMINEWRVSHLVHPS